MATQQELEHYFSKSLEVVKEAGTLVKDAIGKGKSIETKSNFADLVTETDKEVEKLLIGKLKNEFPTHRFIGEESVAAGMKCELTGDPTWIIDPVDGTMNFVHGFPVVAISVALAVNKQVVIGIVFNPVMDRMYTAQLGKGAFCNGHRLRTSGVSDLSKALIVAEGGSNRDPARMEFVFKNMHNIIKKAHGLRSLGSAALNMCFVAAGEADAYYEFGIHCWDMAAAALIATEAGGTVVDTEGGPLNLMNRRVICAATQGLASVISQSLDHIQLESD
ncbi:inositol monophosphatase 2-like [Ornithodoros turicata]